MSADKRIEAVILRVTADETGDLSDLGEFVAQWSPGCVDRQKAGTWSRGEFRYWKPSGNYAGISKAEEHKYNRQDWRRAEAAARGDWWFVGVQAEAVVYIAGVRQVLSSGGLWGIESDSGSAYFEEVAREQVADLRAVCEAVGITAAEFDAADLQEPRYQDAFGIVAGTVLGDWLEAA